MYLKGKAEGMCWGANATDLFAATMKLENKIWNMDENSEDLRAQIPKINGVLGSDKTAPRYSFILANIKDVTPFPLEN